MLSSSYSFIQSNNQLIELKIYFEETGQSLRAKVEKTSQVAELIKTIVDSYPTFTKIGFFHQNKYLEPSKTFEQLGLTMDIGLIVKTINVKAINLKLIVFIPKLNKTLPVEVSSNDQVSELITQIGYHLDIPFEVMNRLCLYLNDRLLENSKTFEENNIMKDSKLELRESNSKIIILINAYDVKIFTLEVELDNTLEEISAFIHQDLNNNPLSNYDYIFTQKNTEIKSSLTFRELKTIDYDRFEMRRIYLGGKFKV